MGSGPLRAVKLDPCVGHPRPQSPLWSPFACPARSDLGGLRSAANHNLSRFPRRRRPTPLSSDFPGSACWRSVRPGRLAFNPGQLRRHGPPPPSACHGVLRPAVEHDAIYNAPRISPVDGGRSNFRAISWIDLPAARSGRSTRVPIPTTVPSDPPSPPVCEGSCGHRLRPTRLPNVPGCPRVVIAPLPCPDRRPSLVARQVGGLGFGDDRNVSRSRPASSLGMPVRCLPRGILETWWWGWGSEDLDGCRHLNDVRLGGGDSTMSRD
jgi:hypothetical protein